VLEDEDEEGVDIDDDPPADYVLGCKDLSEQEMEIQREIAPNDEWMRFLEGKLLAFRLVGEGMVWWGLCRV
jgi:hypothetical protein